MRLEILLVIAALGTTACQSATPLPSCPTEGSQPTRPPQVDRIHSGMALAEIVAVLGEPSYSPSAGQYYFSTGGDCRLGDSGRTAPCGLVADFRDMQDGDAKVTETLQSCWWGAIGE